MGLQNGPLVLSLELVALLVVVEFRLLSFVFLFLATRFTFSLGG